MAGIQYEAYIWYVMIIKISIVLWKYFFFYVACINLVRVKEKISHPLKLMINPAYQAIDHIIKWEYVLLCR